MILIVKFKRKQTRGSKFLSEMKKRTRNFKLLGLVFRENGKENETPSRGERSEFRKSASGKENKRLAAET